MMFEILFQIMFDFFHIGIMYGIFDNRVQKTSIKHENENTGCASALMLIAITIYLVTAEPF